MFSINRLFVTNGYWFYVQVCIGYIIQASNNVQYKYIKTHLRYSIGYALVVKTIFHLDLKYYSTNYTSSQQIKFKLHWPNLYPLLVLLIYRAIQLDVQIFIYLDEET